MKNSYRLENRPEWSDSEKEEKLISKGRRKKIISE